MTAPNRLNLWMAATIGERDLIVATSGLATGDFCLVDETNLYVCIDPGPPTSTWRPIAGLPTFGYYAFSVSNTGPAAVPGVSQHQAFTFRAVLDAAPMGGVTLLAPTWSANWTTMPTVHSYDPFGFTASGTSDALAPGAEAWLIGLYRIDY